MEEAKKLAELAPKIMNAFHDLGRQHPETAKLSMRQFQAMIILNANQKLTLSKLCDKLSLAPSTGTELVNRMISLGYIEKAHGMEDQRQVLLSVTKQGVRLLQKRKRILSKMITQLLDRFEPDDRKLFIQSFENIWNIISKYKKQ